MDDGVRVANDLDHVSGFQHKLHRNFFFFLRKYHISNILSNSIVHKYINWLIQKHCARKVGACSLHTQELCSLKIFTFRLFIHVYHDGQYAFMG